MKTYRTFPSTKTKNKFFSVLVAEGDIHHFGQLPLGMIIVDYQKNIQREFSKGIIWILDEVWLKIKD